MNWMDGWIVWLVLGGVWNVFEYFRMEKLRDIRW